MGALRVQQLGRTVRHDGGELAVVQGVDLVLEGGRAIGVTGPLDSGWRSFLRLVVGLDPLTEGSVSLDDAPRAREELRQECVLASALDPLLSAPPRRLLQGIARLAASRRRRLKAPSWPAILDTAGVGAEARAWTGCERLRLCLALASALEPAHVLLEVEPPLERAEDRSALAEALHRILAAGRGVLLGTRDELLLAEVATHVLIFLDGEVLAEGSPESVIAAAVQRAKRARS